MFYKQEELKKGQCISNDASLAVGLCANDNSCVISRFLS